MTQHADQLREAFESHENLAPDPGAVYARVQELSRKYKRRRRGAQVAGGAVLSAGLIAAGINLPAFLPGHAGGNAGIGVAAPDPVPSVASSYGPIDQNEGLTAYFDAGYGYNDAVQLAALWHTKADIGNVKVEAGRRLIAGETLPIKPTGNPDPTASSTDDPQAKDDQAAFDAFFNAGYVWDDAVKLAKAWHLADPSDAKIKAGKKIEAHQSLPFKPKQSNVKAAKDQAAMMKFWDAGYDQADAVKLAKIWHVSSSEAKVLGGKKLLAGETLPIKP